MTSGRKGNTVKGRPEPAFCFSGVLANVFSILRGDRIVREVYSLSNGLKAPVYMVGGALRNIFLKKEPGRDYDFSLLGDVRGFSQGLSKALGGSFFLLDEESPTWRIVIKKGPIATIDISLLKDGDVLRDLGKRDFTVNAIALSIPDLFGKEIPGLIDPHRGLRDIEEMVLRAVSPRVFDEDPLRLLRAIRLSQQYAFRIEESTGALIKEKGALLSESAAERIRDEVALIFSHPGSWGSIEKLFQAGILGVIFPELKGWGSLAGYDLLGHSLNTLREAEVILSGRPLHAGLKGHFEGMTGGIGREAVFKIGAFLHDIGKPAAMKFEEGVLGFIGHEVEGEAAVKRVLKRLKMSRKAVKAVATLVRNHHRIFTLAGLPKPSLRARSHFFNSAGGELGCDLLLIGLSDARATGGGEDERLLRVVLDMLGFYFDVYSKRKPKPLLSGDEIKHVFGVDEGPAVGEIMREISEGVEEGAVRTKKDAVAYVRRHLKGKGIKPS
ncbi:MAG: HD domain-containing protein [Deltaproteobacteria bacterium]|nr:HD domain-containing protein [Deltaproteobacteria bacterium]